MTWTAADHLLFRRVFTGTALFVAGVILGAWPSAPAVVATSFLFVIAIAEWW